MSTMFRIEFVVAKEDLGDCMEAIEPFAYNLQTPQRVANPVTTKSKKKKEVTLMRVGTQQERVFGTLIKQGKQVGDVVTSHDIRESMKEHGIPHDSYSSVVARLKDTGHLENGETRGLYTLMQGA